jgi:hypothetical protein
VCVCGRVRVVSLTSVIVAPAAQVRQCGHDTQEVHGRRWTHHAGADHHQRLGGTANSGRRRCALCSISSNWVMKKAHKRRGRREEKRSG